MKKLLLALLCAVLVLALCACGKSSKAEVTPPTPEAAPLPTTEPMPTPTPEPVYEKGYAVTVEGSELPSGSFLIDGENCVLADELSAASKTPVDTAEKYIPIEKYCEDNNIGTLYDDEFNHFYCTYAAGDWTLPQGYDVPVIMYHEVQPEANGGDGDTTPLEDFEEQIAWLVDNGYSMIWLEDLEHVEDYEKPVILTFDDGYVGNLLYVTPVLEKYDIKATMFYFVVPIYHLSRYLTPEQVVEMQESGRWSIQSHTMNHPYLNSIAKSEQEYELKQSRLEITRLTGQIPYAIAYPYGDTTGYVCDEIHNGLYRFGLKMVGLRSYNTADDVATVWRFWPYRHISMAEYTSWFTSTFE